MDRRGAAGLHRRRWCGTSPPRWPTTRPSCWVRAPTARRTRDAFIDLVNEVTPHYAEFGADPRADAASVGFAPDFAFLRYLGSRLEPTLPPKDQRWVLDQVMASEAPEAVAIVQDAMRNLLSTRPPRAAAHGLERRLTPCAPPSNPPCWSAAAIRSTSTTTPPTSAGAPPSSPARARRIEDLIVDVADPAALGAAERQALLQRCARCNMAIYRSRRSPPTRPVRAPLGAQLGLHRLDANWLADEDGISQHHREPTAARGAARRRRRGGFIPYTDRPINWHTDGYYHPEQRRIRAMVLHCVRPARSGGVNALLDHELAYIALRDASPRWARALMAPDAMTIPAPRRTKTASRGRRRAGPVFSVDAQTVRCTCATPRARAASNGRPTRARAGGGLPRTRC